MEKFSSWRDKATGISPFMPNQFPLVQEKSPIKKWTKIILKSPIFVLKFPFFLLISLLYSILGLPILLKFIIRFLFGFNRIDFSVDGVKKSQTDKLNSFKPHPNDIIVANYISPLDGYFFAMLSNSSKIVILVPDKKGDLYQHTPRSLFNHCFTYDNGKQPLVEDLSTLKDKIVFLLLEGTPSNNKSVLPFIKLNSRYKFDENFKIKSLILKIIPNYFTLPISYIGKFQYLFQLLTNLSKNSLIRFKIYKYYNFDLTEIRCSYELNSLSLINQDLNLDSKEKFINYYFDHSVNKTKKNV